MRKSPLSLEDVLTDKVREEDLIEVQITERSFRWLFIGVSMLVVIALLQVINIGVVNHSLYAEQAFANMSDVEVIHAPRGIILDRFGEPLVENEGSFNVVLIPRYLPTDVAERIAELETISELTDIPIDALKEKVAQRNWSISDRLFLTNELTQDSLVALSSSEMPSIKLEPAFKRAHVDPKVFSHITGYIGLVDEKDLTSNNANLVIDSEVGRSGLEGYYDRELRGLDGKKLIFRDARGELEGSRIEQEPEGGHDLTTFIDADFQRFFYNRLQETLTSLGREVGVGIAIDPSNGEVLALVNIPSFDAEHPAASLNKSSKPFFNRAVSGLYNPGSTIKPLVGVAALVEGVVTPETSIFSSGKIEVPNPYNPDRPSIFLDWKAHGWVTIRSAIARSSNVYFYEVGGGFESQKGIGISNLNKWWELFGLNKPTGIDLVGEESGFLPTPDWKEKRTGEPWRVGDTYNVTIGQGDLLITPIELLNYIAAVANNGIIYQPRVVRSIASHDGDTIKTTSPVRNAYFFDKMSDELREVQLGMRDGVLKPYGTSHLLDSVPMAIAAKTGSAQVANNTKTNAFFVGYGPFENPRIAILVLIEDAREGSLNAVPVARDVFMWYYEHRLKRE